MKEFLLSASALLVFCSSLSDDPEVGPGDGHRQKAQAKAEELPYSDGRERKR